MPNFNLNITPEELSSDISYYLKDYRFKEVEEIELFLEQYNEESIRNTSSGVDTSQSFCKENGQMNENIADEYGSVSDTQRPSDEIKNSFNEEEFAVEEKQKESLQNYSNKNKDEMDVFEDEKWN